MFTSLVMLKVWRGQSFQATPYKKTQLKTLITFDSVMIMDFKLGTYTSYVKTHYFAEISIFYDDVIKN